MADVDVARAARGVGARAAILRDVDKDKMQKGFGDLLKKIR